MVSEEECAKVSLCQEITEEKPPISRIFTFVTFFCTLLSIPFIVICFILTKVLKKSWLAVLSMNFPEMKFVGPDSVGTLLDTHRNQGIINVLMVIKGQCDSEVIKEALEGRIVERRTKKGSLLYPILRFRLLSCWGNYAWKKADEFDINNHVLISSPKYRGRHVSYHNLQDYVSAITSKFLLNTQPPWQVIIIPNIVSTERTYGLLIRVHHLILEEGSLNIGDFLCLKPESEQFSREMDSMDMEDFDTLTPFNDVVKPPVAMSALFSRLSDSLSNHWNEFISDFDPITSPELFKKNPGFFDYIARILITFVSAYKDTRKYIEISERPRRIIHYYFRALSYERKKRKITIVSFIISVLITFNPVSFIFNILKIILWLIFAIFLKIPYQIYQEFLSIRSIVRHAVCFLPNTATAIIYNYSPLIYEAAKEVTYIASTLYTAPATIIHEMFYSNKNLEEHHLQKTSSCGRKVVAWSEPVSRRWIKDIADKEEVSETEVLLSMVSDCIKEYFHHGHHPVPKTVPTFAKILTFDKLLSTHEQKTDNDRSKGIVFFTMPMHKMCFGPCDADIKLVSKEFRRVITSQAAIFILTSMHDWLSEIFPSVYARIFLNYTTRKFSVGIVEIVEGKYNMQGHNRRTLWNDEVISFFYWRPPQSNVGMSLTMQRYADTVRLTVMTDALLSPHHQVPARHWIKAAKKLDGHPDQIEEQPARMDRQSSPEDVLQSQYSSSPTNSSGSSNMRDYPGYSDFRSNSSEISTEDSNLSEVQSSPTYIFDYILDNEYPE